MPTLSATDCHGSDMLNQLQRGEPRPCIQDTQSGFWPRRGMREEKGDKDCHSTEGPRDASQGVGVTTRCFRGICHVHPKARMTSLYKQIATSSTTANCSNNSHLRHHHCRLRRRRQHQQQQELRRRKSRTVSPSTSPPPAPVPTPNGRQPTAIRSTRPAAASVGAAEAAATTTANNNRKNSSSNCSSSSSSGDEDQHQD